MSEGELLQIEKAKKLDIDEKIYIDIISKSDKLCWLNDLGSFEHHKIFEVSETESHYFIFKYNLILFYTIFQNQIKVFS